MAPTCTSYRDRVHERLGKGLTADDSDARTLNRADNCLSSGAWLEPIAVRSVSQPFDHGSERHRAILAQRLDSARVDESLERARERRATDLAKGCSLSQILKTFEDREVFAGVSPRVVGFEPGL